MTFPLVAIALLVAGIGAGWMLATARRKRWNDLSSMLAQAETGSDGEGRPIARKTRTLEIRCACGAVTKFRDPVEPGYQPFPTGDSLTCPSCGRVKDLSKVRGLGV